MEYRDLGSILENTGSTSNEITTRIGQANAPFNRLKRIWKSKNYLTRLKLSLFNNNVIPVLLYAAETWSLKKQQQRRFLAFENNCLFKYSFVRQNHKWKKSVNLPITLWWLTSLELGGGDAGAMFAECRRLRSQKPLYIGTEREVEDGEDLKKYDDQYISLICAVIMLLFNPIGRTYTQLPNSEEIDQASWMPWVPVVSQVSFRSDHPFIIYFDFHVFQEFRFPPHTPPNVTGSVRDLKRGF